MLPVLLVVAAAAVYQFAPEPDASAEYVRRAGPLGPVVFIVAGTVMMSLMTPKTLVSLAAGGLFGTLIGSGVMMVTASLAATLNYTIGRWWLADSAKRRIDRIVREDRSGRGEIIGVIRSMAHDAGFGLHLLLRLTPVPTFVISYLMGACRARFAPFLSAAMVAVIPQLLWVHSGSAAGLIGEPDASGLKWFSIAIAVAGAVMISVIVPPLAIKRLRKNRMRTPGATD